MSANQSISHFWHETNKGAICTFCGEIRTPWAAACRPRGAVFGALPLKVTRPAPTPSEIEHLAESRVGIEQES